LRNKGGHMDRFFELRRQAEAILRERASQASSAGILFPAEDALRVLHELSVHQIELEMQNEELQRTLQEVETGRERYSNFYDLSPVGFCSLSNQGMILEVNLTLAGMLGRPRSELVGQSYSRYILREHLDVFRSHFRQLFETSAPQAYDLQMVNADGSVFWAHLAPTIIKNNDELKVCRLVVSDITERKEAEEASKESEHKYRTLFETLTEGVALHEVVKNENGEIRDYRILDVNPAFQRHTGLDPVSARGKLATELYDAPIPPYLEEYTSVVLTGKPCAFETFFPPLEKHFRISVFSTNPMQFATVFEDITEQKETEKTLRMAHQFNELILANAQEGIVVYGPDLRYQVWNPFMEKLSGIPADEVIGKHPLALFPFLKDGGVIEQLGNILVGGPAVLREFPFQIPSTGRSGWSSDLSSPLRDRKGEIIGIIGLIRDITEQKDREDEQALVDGLVTRISMAGDLHRCLSELTESLQSWSGCEAVGIRLRLHEDFPYFETRGFPPSFVQAENHLCSYGESGEILRDDAGNPVLECMCGNVLCRRFNPNLPFFTNNGSFWTNSTTVLLASTTPEDRQAHTRNRCNGEGYESVALVPFKDGHQVWGLIQFNDRRPNRFTPEMIAKYERTASNITSALAQHIAEVALRKSEERFRLAMDANNDGLWDWDILSGETYFSPANARMLGCEPSGLPGQMASWLEMILPEDRTGVVFSKQECIGGLCQSFELEYRLKTRDGGLKWILGRGRAVSRDEHGQASRMVGTHMDITERKEAEARLRESEEKFSKTYHLSPDAIDLTHLETGVLVEANQSYQKMFGYTREELLGRSTLPGGLGNWVSEENRNRHIARLKEHGEDLEFEALLRRKDGSIFMGLISSSLVGINGVHYNLSIIRDISERLKIEAEIRSLNQNLEQRVKDRTAQLEAANKEMEAFSYSVSHDLRAPLRSIDGFSQVLLEDYQDQVDEAGRHYLTRIRLGAQRMGNLIDDLLKLSKTSRSELRVTECDLSWATSRNLVRQRQLTLCI